MTQRTGGQALVDALEAHAVDTVFGIPGTHNLGAFAALAHSSIKTVLTRHEQGAGYAADGYARVSGSPGVVLTTTGPAILNAAAAAAQAWSDSVPVLFISPGLPVTHPAMGNGYLHEVKDQQGALQAVCKYSHRVTSIQEIPRAVAFAFSEMTTGRPRPVHLEIPLEILDEMSDVGAVSPITRTETSAQGDSIAGACTLLEDASAPVIIAGGGARRASEEVRLLAERLSAPVVSSINGKGVLDEGHALSVGAGLHQPSVQTLLRSSDAVLAIGTEMAPSDLGDEPLSIDSTLIRVDVDPLSMITNADPRVRLVGDASVVGRQLLEHLGAGRREVDEARAREAHRALHRQAEVDGAPWRGIVGAVSRFVDERTVIAGDSAMACYLGALTVLRVHRPSGFLYPTGQGTLGYGLPAAIGASVAEPDSRVIAIMGDGGVMFTLPELATAADLGISLPVIVVDNGGYGEIHNEMDDRRDEVHAVSLGAVDFRLVAEGLGCRGVSIAEPEELATAIETALSGDRPTVIHVRETSRASKGMTRQ